MTLCVRRCDTPPPETGLPNLRRIHRPKLVRVPQTLKDGFISRNSACGKLAWKLFVHNENVPVTDNQRRLRAINRSHRAFNFERLAANDYALEIRALGWCATNRTLVMTDENAKRLRHYLTRKLAEHLESLEHALDQMDTQGDANMVDLEYNHELLIDADNCLHGILWIIDVTDDDGNWKPSKKKSIERIDGIVALIMALDLATSKSKPECFLIV